MTADPLRAGDPDELGGYRLLGRLGQGGMGAVYLGEGRDGRLVAVKAIRPDLAGEPEFRARFRSEVNRARAVPAFCTAPVLDADPDRVNPEMVDLEPLDADDENTVRDLLSRHATETGSPVASALLDDWRPERYTRVMPRDYKRVLTAMREAEQSGQDANELIMGALRG